MKGLIQTLLLMVLTFPVLCEGKLQVFACEPEWKALVDELGGKYVEAFSATTQMQNPHYISAKPSLLAKMRQSDLVICSGSGLESGWLPVLLKSAGKAQVQPGNIGHFMASEQVERLEVISDASLIDRSLGDIHPEGNPHVHLNPRLMLEIANALAERLVVLDAAREEHYRAMLKSFTYRLESSLVDWSQQRAIIKGKNYIAYHKNWSYLAQWLGINIVDTIERKPGIAPSARHISSLVSQYKESPIDAILLTPFENRDAADMLAAKLGTRVITLPYTTDNQLLGLYEAILMALLT